MNEFCSGSRKHSVPVGLWNRRMTSYVRDGKKKKNDSHNSSKLCENVGISTSARVQKCHYQADMVLNLNSTSLFGKSSAEERIKVLIKLHARGGLYVYIPAMILSPLLFFCRLPFYFFFLRESEAHPAAPTLHGRAAHLWSENWREQCKFSAGRKFCRQKFRRGNETLWRFERRGRSRCERTVVSSSLMEEMQNADYFLFCVCVQEKRNEESS